MNGETRLGLYTVGGIVLAPGLVILGAFALLTQGVLALTRMARDETFDGNGNANGNLYVEVRSCAITPLLRCSNCRRFPLRTTARACSLDSSTRTVPSKEG